MAKVRWSKDSLDSLKDICKYIAQDSPYYSRVFKDSIFEMVEHLERFPKLGRIVLEVNDNNIREIFYKRYRIIYQLNEDVLEIITILHGSRLLTF